MAFKYKKAQAMVNLNLVPMIDITSFILLSLAILVLSMKKEASLDNILELPPVLHASKQDTTQLQIYILPAKVDYYGQVVGDSTGLVAFTGKGGIPDSCERCGLRFRDRKTKEYVPGSLLDLNQKPIAAMKMEQTKPGTIESAGDKAKNKERPPAYLCSRCQFEISPYLKIDDIPRQLAIKKKEILNLLAAVEDSSRARNKRPLLTEAEKKEIDGNIPLMIKADDKSFYGRIIQVVFKVKADTACNIKKFAFVTLGEATLEAQNKKKADEAKGGQP